ncbi:hypothetical protein [Nonomuraea sp. LPB2021202275-12-8]|uniref:hypothetical protein n=1 Tax=Nonomuraea sp. LPB2021202275-12-8 TaxID=3120159 RepID=UPI00300D43AE
MSERPDEPPEAANGLGGESDVVAERSGASTERARRPIPADPPEARDDPAADDEASDEASDEDESAEEDEERDGGDAGEETRPDVGPTG